MNELVFEIEKAYQRRFDKKLSKLLKVAVEEKELQVLPIASKIMLEEKENGFMLAEVTRAFFRIKRESLTDCSPLFEAWPVFDEVQITVHSAFLDVLGYDRMRPSIQEQEKIIHKYFSFGDDTDYRYFTDPRYGLAAACAGWEAGVVKPFLEYCIEKDDAPLIYVAKNSLMAKYVKLRGLY